MASQKGRAYVPANMIGFAQGLTVSLLHAFMLSMPYQYKKGARRAGLRHEKYPLSVATPSLAKW